MWGLSILTNKHGCLLFLHYGQAGMYIILMLEQKWQYFWKKKTDKLTIINDL